MPSTNTITAFYTFATGGSILSAEHNTNFGNIRGNFLPIDPTLQAAAHLSYNLGSQDHRWQNVFGNLVADVYTATAQILIGSTTNASVILCDPSTAAFSVVLPNPTTGQTGAVFFIKKVGSSANTITVSVLSPGTATGYFIDGTVAVYLSDVNDFYGLVAGANHYSIISSSEITGAAGSTTSLGMQTVTSAATVTVTSNLIICNASTAAFALTLPVASSYTGLKLHINKEGTDFNAVTVTRNGADTIDGTTTVVLLANGDFLTLMPNGVATWKIVSQQMKPIKVFAFVNASSTNLHFADGGTEIIDFNVETIDTHNALTSGTTTCFFTAKRPGTFIVQSAFESGGEAVTANDTYRIEPYIGGVLAANRFAWLEHVATASNINTKLNGSIVFQLALNDLLDIRGTFAGAGTISANTATNSCYLSITEILP